MNIFEETLEMFSSKTRVRTLFKEVHYEDMYKIIERLQHILSDKKAEIDAQMSDLLQKKQDVEYVLLILEEKGLSIDDLTAARLQAKMRPRQAPRKQLFRFENADGHLVEWLGSHAGRAPKEFVNYLARTQKSRYDCAVSTD